MAENYDFKQVEEKIIKFWEKENVFKFNPNKKGQVYAIDTPPPTVSGKMHIGHAFSYSQQDFLARYHRMKGDNVFYPFGTDDNGLPTERLVEKTKNVHAKDMSREDFIKLCMEFLKEELPRFIHGWKRIGVSSDFDIYYSTINEHSRRISQWSFLDLHKKNRIYRKDAPAMWCPECQTGVSQVEIKDKEIESTFNTIIFKVGKENIKIATTRPEFLPACVAIFYHPDDKRFKSLKGKKAKVPLFDFEVPILEDKRADPEKGTGIVMCCTFGDQTDMEWQKAHNLPIKEAITPNGKMSELAGKYNGLNIKEAREKIIHDLKDAGLLTEQKKISHFVNVHERCGKEIEFIKSKQWFVKYLDLREDMLKWGAKLKWHPEFMKTRYDNWVKGLQWDWLISNQRYFGVPFPVWYCKKCGEAILAEEKQLPVNPLKDKPLKKCKCGNNEFIPEKDILNTWFTSSMSPQIAIKLMPDSIQKNLFPMALRPQAHEIITFWLFNTVFKSNIHFGKNPWENVMISGFVTLEGEKMSKSKGNVVEPSEVIDKYGADALRFWAAGSRLGEDLDYQEKDLVTGKRFITKLWNASNFVFMNLKDYNHKKPKKIEKIDELFLIKLNSLIKNCTEHFEEYEYSKAKSEAEKFFWSMFCDNYLEIVKKRIYENKENKESAQYVLYHSLFSILKLMAPLMPFITEEIYQLYFKNPKNSSNFGTQKTSGFLGNEKEKSIHISQWPSFEKEGKTDELDLFIEILSKVRQEKTKAQKSMKAEIILSIEKENMKKLKDILGDLKDVTNAKEIKEDSFKVEFV
ncbi:MAG: valine--tRNA ligase [Candidatus Nanoarchaeia archaeon]|nr:valine--tRNA ligase [Candidatus Nanoarchaeia archaeon]